MSENKNLPIRFFSKRENDTMQTEGGGGGDLPRFVITPYTAENREILLAKAASVGHVLSAVSQTLETKKKLNSPIPTVVKTTLNEEAIAKSHRKEVRKLLDPFAQDKIIGFDGKNELIIEIDSQRQVNEMQKRAADINNNYYSLSCIDKIEVFQPSITLETERCNYKLKMIPFKNRVLTGFLNSRLESFFAGKNLEYTKTQYTNEISVYKLKDATLDDVDGITRLEISDALFAIEPIDRYNASLDWVQEDDKLLVMEPEKDKIYPVIGVLDSGISKNKYLAPWIVGSRSPYTDMDLDKRHGTFVAGILVYGDLLENDITTNAEPCYLYDAAVFPAEGIDEDDLVRNIQEVVRQNKSIKIWNMSLGGKQEICDHKFSDFAVAIDALQDECDVLICTSCGNTDNFLTGKPKERITNSADSVRSLVIGSSTHEDGLVKKNYPSPFSRVGRGPAAIIKPDVVHMGGNVGQDLKLMGVNSIGLNGQMVKSCGTSFSTPRTTGMIGTLSNKINNGFDPLLLKALLIHSAHYPTDVNLDAAQKVKEMGYGIPRDVSDILNNSDNEITLILSDTLEKGKYIDIFDFPMPSCLIKNGFFTGEIIVTLVSNPIIDSTQGGEYCQSHIDLFLGTYDQLKDRHIEESNMLKNPIGRDGSQNILLNTQYSRREMQKNAKSTLTEQNLINNNDKFYPVKKYAVNLSEMTEGKKKKHLSADKRWYLKLEGLYRENSELSAIADGVILNQDFCLIITLRDSSNIANVYDGTVQKLNQFNFVHNAIEIRNNIRVNN